MPFLISLVCLLVLAGPDLSLPGVQFPTPTGKVWVETASPGSGKPREAVGRGLIASPPERVFRALTDYAHWAEFMPFLERSDARPQPDGSVLSDQAARLPPPGGERRYQLRFRSRIETRPSGRTWKVDWTYVPGSGNIADQHGSWSLTAFGRGQTFAVCRLYTDAGGLAPHWAVDRGTTETVPWIFHGLRQQVQRSRYDPP
jgi:hypothetical protein